MKTRLVTGIFLALILVPAFYLGGSFLNIVLMLMSMGATYELLNMFKKQHEVTNVVMGVFMMLSVVLYHVIRSYYDNPVTFDLEWVFMTVVLIVFMASFLLVLLPKFSVDNFGQILVAVLYPALGFGAIYGIRSDSVINIGFLFMITIFTDIFAYIVGVRIGKHKLAVHISPKKSIEGSIGGTISAVILTMIYIYVLKVNSIGDIELTFVVSIALIILISVMGQIGDLVASKMKRSYGIKDFSNIFPGHGGVLDRFDSVLFAGMVLMLLSEFIGVLS
jgi:phosphatidate cytidylyltransferase